MTSHAAHTQFHRPSRPAPHCAHENTLFLVQHFLEHYELLFLNIVWALLYMCVCRGSRVSECVREVTFNCYDTPRLVFIHSLSF